jgi:DNA-binding transcriptional LysR family regulator
MPNWNDLRYLLAVSRGQTLSAAAKSLGVDDTTVARRIAALERALDARLVHRVSNGSLQLSAAGEAAVQRAAAMEREIGLLEAAVGGDDRAVVGVVRLTSVPVLVNRILAPAAATLFERHPRLRLELVADARDYNLTRREADLALRLARPKTGGMRVKARRMGTLAYAPYGPSACAAREMRKLPWITYGDTMAHLPQARWIAKAVADDGGAVAQVKVHDAETALESAAAGLGRTLLPVMVAERDPRLRRLADRARQPALRRDAWLLAHAELASLARIQAVAQWIEELLPR